MVSGRIAHRFPGALSLALCQPVSDVAMQLPPVVMAHPHVDNLRPLRVSAGFALSALIAHEIRAIEELNHQKS